MGQALATGFQSRNRIFLAGDAVHTHTPNAGQGMNTSIQDVYNLGWKLGLVLKGLAPRSLLETYEQERMTVAQQLIEFDRKWAQLFSGEPMEQTLKESGLNMEQFLEIWRQNLAFSTALGITYPPNVLVTDDKTSKPDLAKNVVLGMRIPSCQIVNQSDACPIHLGKRLNNDGRFRIIVFVGDVLKSKEKQRMANFCTALEKSDFFLHAYTPKGQLIDSIFEIITIHTANRVDIDVLDFPEILRPCDPQLGWPYDKIYVGEKTSDGPDANSYYGVDPEKGCVIVVRPDQHVGYIGALEGFENINSYFASVFVKR